MAFLLEAKLPMPAIDKWKLFASAFIGNRKENTLTNAILSRLKRSHFFIHPLIFSSVLHIAFRACVMVRIQRTIQFTRFNDPSDFGGTFFLVKIFGAKSFWRGRVGVRDCPSRPGNDYLVGGPHEANDRPSVRVFRLAVDNCQIILVVYLLLVSACMGRHMHFFNNWERYIIKFQLFNWHKLLQFMKMKGSRTDDLANNDK